ncbi:hypothetical protein OV207_07925 [Corallococcus sp. BB11-1]|uniref:Ig-like domain-containing protein n=1 Tax=Corallococcus sp. BB11-1 TaxID=2996783 RepID=UPI002271321B|nr:hypothetical protein [Corallococcus sp. BB11-1]MCY1031380.1 hypothetical protein [Corallococcus sp. BB11-1]
MRSLKTLPVVALLLMVAVGCGSESATGSAEFVIAMQEFAATPGSVVRVTATVTGTGFEQSQDLTQTSGTWGGTVQGIPAGTGRVVTVTGYDGANKKLYEGQATNVTISEGQTTLVAITLQDLTTPQNVPNDVPIIDAVTASDTTVTAGGQLTLSVSAHDPVVADTLSYTWTASAGSLSSSTSTTTIWTAPTSPQTVTLTVTVRDTRGGVSTARLTVTVNAAIVGGGVDIQVSFNTPPLVISVTASEGRVRLGQSTSLAGNAFDTNFDPMTFAWTAACPGTFSNPTGMTTQFTPSSVPAEACNNCGITYTVRDNHGGEAVGTLLLCVVPAGSYTP